MREDQCHRDAVPLMKQSEVKRPSGGSLPETGCTAYSSFAAYAAPLGKLQVVQGGFGRPELRNGSTPPIAPPHDIISNGDARSMVIPVHQQGGLDRTRRTRAVK